MVIVQIIMLNFAIMVACKAPEARIGYQFSHEERGDESIARLIELLGSESFEERERAMTRIIAQKACAVEPLQRALKDKDPERVKRARLCLEGITAHLAVPNCISELKNLAGQSRASSLKHLLEFGLRPSTIGPDLDDSDDLDPTLHSWFLYAFGTLAPKGAVTIPRTVRMLLDELKGLKCVMRVRAVKKLWDMRPLAITTVPDLVCAFYDRDPIVRKWALHTLTDLLGGN